MTSAVGRRPVIPLEAEAHVWLGSVEALSSDAVAVIADRWLSAEERARLDRFVCPRARVRHRAARILLRHALARFTGTAEAALEIVADARGKPRLIGTRRDVRFNLSHSVHQVVVAICEGCEIGVDVEEESSLPPRPTDDLFGLGSAFDAEDRRALAVIAEPLRRSVIICAWTMKEAIAKAIGLGLALPLEAVKVPLSDVGSQEIEVVGHPEPWSVDRRLLEEGVWFSVAVPRSSLRLRFRETFDVTFAIA